MPSAKDQDFPITTQALPYIVLAYHAPLTHCASYFFNIEVMLGVFPFIPVNFIIQLKKASDCLYQRVAYVFL